MDKLPQDADTSKSKKLHGSKTWINISRGFITIILITKVIKCKAIKYKFEKNPPRHYLFSLFPKNKILEGGCM